MAYHQRVCESEEKEMKSSAIEALGLAQAVFGFILLGLIFDVSGEPESLIETVKLLLFLLFITNVLCGTAILSIGTKMGEQK